MNKWLRLVSISLVIFLLGSVAVLAAPEKVKIGFLVKMPEELWFQNEWKFAQQAADKYGFELIKIGTPDGPTTLTAIDNLAAQGAQGFIICTPDPLLGPAIMSKANSYGMKVLAVDDQFVGPDGEFMDVHYMGISARKIGEMVGHALYEEFLNRGWNVEDTAAMAITFDELDTVKQRTDGSADALIAEGFPAAQIHRAAERTTDVPGAFEAASALLAKHQKVKHWLVFSVNDEGVLGALRALEQRGYAADDIIAIGIGAGDGLMEWNKQEETGYFACALISPVRHGYETAELMYKWIKDGIEPPKTIYTAGELVTRENYKERAKALGLDL